MLIEGKRTSKQRGQGIDSVFSNNFLNSLFYKNVFCSHAKDLILGIRNGYINIYYNCDSIAKIRRSRNELKAELSTYYLTGNGSGTVKIKANELLESYNTIIEHSKKRVTPEKKAQHALFVNSNSNEGAEWYCVDVEYKKSYCDEDDRKDNFTGRFDIIAVSKSLPHRVAIIELKYGSAAIGGESGIRKHISDFSAFAGKDKEGNSYYEELKNEIVSIVDAQKLLKVNVPDEIKNIADDNMAEKPEFYVITLDNNSDGKGSTPKMTMSGYLFRDKRWDCKQLSSLLECEGDYFDLVSMHKQFKVTFLFCEQTNDNLTIDDLLNDKFYDKEIIVGK